MLKRPQFHTSTTLWSPSATGICRAGATALALLLTLAPWRTASAIDYSWTLDVGTANWASTLNWSPTPAATGPVAGDTINMAISNATGTTNLALAGNRDVATINKTGTKRWDLIGNAATLSTLTVGTINAATTNFIFRDGAGGGGLQVNATNINVSTGGVLFFGSTSLSASNLMRGLTVSGTTSVTGGTLHINVDNAQDSYTLGLLSVSGTGIVNLNNAPDGKGATTGNVSGLNGTGGFIQNGTNASTTTRSTLVINNTLDYSSASVLRNTNTGGGTANGFLAVVKEGTGTQVLTGSNNYTGTTTVNNGTLQFGRQLSLYNNTPASWTAASLIVNSGGTAAFNAGGTGEFTAADLSTLLGLGTGSGGFLGGSFAGIDTTNAGGSFTYGAVIGNTNGGTNALGLAKLGTGTLVLGTANTYTGATQIRGGTLSIAADAALGQAPGAATLGHLVINGGTLAATADVTLAANRGISLGAGGGTLDVTAGATLGYGGGIAGAGALTKAGTGTLALSGAGSFTGAAAVQAGTLAISHGTALGTAAGGVTVANLATLQLSGNIMVGAEALSLTGDGAAAGQGALHNLSGANSWAGDLDITNGGTRIHSEAGSLLISGNIITSGTGNFNVGGNGDIEISGVISGVLQLFKSSVGTGTVTLSNPGNTYTNHTTVAAGTLKISTEGNLGITPASFSAVKLRIRSGGTLQTTADMSISTNRGITVSNGGGAIRPDAGTTLTVNSRISGVAADLLTKTGAGTLVVTAASTYEGGTAVNEGTLMVANATGSGTGTAAVTVNAGATLAGHHGGSGNIAGTVTIGSGGFLSPGQTAGTANHGSGALQITGLNMQSGSTMRLNIEGTDAGTLDKVYVLATNGLTLDGRISVTTGLTGPAFDSTFAPGATFDLLDWAGVLGGTFDVGAQFRDGSGDNGAQFDLPDLSTLGRTWDVSQFLNSGIIMVSAVPEPSRALLVLTGFVMLFGRRTRTHPEASEDR